VSADPVTDGRKSFLTALALSGPLAVLVVLCRALGSDAWAHGAGFAAIILGLPWVVPSLVAIAVASAPIYVALHIAGHPQELLPWLSDVVLAAAILACHLNSILLLSRLRKKARRGIDAGLGEFLFRTAVASARSGS
jgi:hypothetical protein